MQDNLNLTTKEMGLIESALQSSITSLKQRFNEEDGFVHPAKKYELLHDKLFEWVETLPSCNISLSAEQIL